jgi:dTDP-glucose pyrophosphorylase
MTAPFDSCRIRLGESLRHALRSLEASGLGIALVEEAGGKLAGILTDGDIRRALLSGATLECAVDEYTQRNFVAVGPAASRAEVLDLMQSRWLNQIPILDAEARLLGLHTLHEILGAASRPNWAVVMAGGRGERLRPLTDALPKPMIRVAGRPILERIVLHLVGFGFRQIFLAVNYKGELIEEHFGDGAAFGCSISYLRERRPLGTGGALSLLPLTPQHPLLVLNGDLLTQFDAGSLLSFHGRGAYRATVGVHQYAHTVPFGVVELKDDRIVRIREKPSEIWETNAGIYVIEPDLLKWIEPNTYFPFPALIEECLERGESVGAFHVEQDWIDVGHQSELRRARGLV